jgi:hypothetical protein
MPRPATFGNAVVRYFSFRLLPDPPAAGGRLTEYVTRNGPVIVALAALLLIGGAWYLFAGGKSAAPAGGGPNGKAGRSVAVITTHPAKKEFAYEVEALGTLRANEFVNITAKVADRVAAIHFNEGQQVRKGDVLIELDNTEARADLAAAEVSTSAARSCSTRRRCRKRNSTSCRRRCSQTKLVSRPRARVCMIASSLRHSTGASVCAT